MKIVIQTNKLKCDMGVCTNMADYSVVPDGVDKSRYINLCKDCMQNLYDATSKILVPKSPKNIYMRNKGRGEQ